MYMTSKINLATFFGLGYISRAPGTLGSIAAFPVACIFVYLSHLFAFFSYPLLKDIIPNQFGLLIVSYIWLAIFTIILFIIGLNSTYKYLKLTSKNDPSEVIIDEVVAQSIVIYLAILPYYFLSSVSSSLKTSFLIVSLTLAFLCFRIFDIVKPWPINVVDEKVEGAIGVMLDDIVAAFLATVTTYALIFVFADIIGIK